MDPEKTYNRSGTLTFRIFVYQAFKNNPEHNYTHQARLTATPYDLNGKPPSVSFRPLTVSAFNLRLRFIPDNSGKVIISLLILINMGRFIRNIRKPRAQWEAPFTVTAQQNVGTQIPFVAPLAIEFRTNGLTLAYADSTVILVRIINKKTMVSRLSVRMWIITPVKFNVKQIWDLSILITVPVAEL